MKTPPNGKSVVTDISLVYTEFLRVFKDRSHTGTEKILFLLVAPVWLPVATIGVLLGFDKHISEMAALLVALFSIFFAIVYSLVTYGPALIQHLNTYVNG